MFVYRIFGRCLTSGCRALGNIIFTLICVTVEIVVSFKFASEVEGGVVAIVNGNLSKRLPNKAAVL
jgi:hypothetical protein